MSYPIDVLGVGPGGGEWMTREAGRIIEEADVVFASSQFAGFAPGKALPLLPLSASIEKMKRYHEEGARVCVLVTGDTGLYSLLPMLGREIGAQALRAHPGVSSLQVFAAKMCRSWQNARILSAHGRDLSPSALCHAARTCGEVYVFLDREHGPHWVHESLEEGGLAHVKLTIGEALTLPEECVGEYDEDRMYDGRCLALIENDAPETGLPPVGLPDDAFIRGKTPMTKREIRAQVIAALQLKPDAVVWDVGAGTGSISIECTRQCPMGEIYAIERDEHALELIGQNKAAFHALNLEIVPGRAPDALHALRTPTHVFLGGTSGEAEAIVDLLRERGGTIRVAATAVTMESAETLLALMRGMDNFSASQIAVSRLEAVGGYTMLKAQNPVFLFAGTMRGGNR